MSWSVQFKGDSHAVKSQFDTAIAQSKTNGIIAPELAEMRETADFVVYLAEKNKGVQGYANGSWNAVTVHGMSKSTFSQLSMNVQKQTE
jgi:hypothetical protein